MALTFNDITLSLGGVKQLKQEPRTTRKESRYMCWEWKSQSKQGRVPRHQYSGPKIAKRFVQLMRCSHHTDRMMQTKSQGHKSWIFSWFVHAKN